jgi:hypothetical protein
MDLLTIPPNFVDEGLKSLFRGFSTIIRNMFNSSPIKNHDKAAELHVMYTDSKRE